jgi:hypothetical protein
MGSEHSKTERLNTECAPTIRGRCMCGDICYEITGPMFDVVPSGIILPETTQPD